MKKIKDYLKIMVVLAISLVAVKFIAPDIFLAQSPTVRSDWSTALIAHVKGIFDPYYGIAGVFNRGNLPENKLKDVPFSAIAPGVNAKSRDNYSYTVVSDKDVVWIEHVYNVDGQIIRIKVPQGSDMPLR